jgi:hypothetical protein
VNDKYQVIKSPIYRPRRLEERGAVFSREIEGGGLFRSY